MTCIDHLQERRAKILCPLAFCVCFFGPLINEVTLANRNCTLDGMMTPDVRWISRGTMLFLVPLTFTLTMDEVKCIGNRLGLSFDVNEVKPSIFCRCECLIPSALVGISLCFFIGCMSWIVCAPFEASIFGLVGMILMSSGFGFSRYLRGLFPFCGYARKQQQDETERGADIEAAGAAAQPKSTLRPKKKKKKKPPPQQQQQQQYIPTTFRPKHHESYEGYDAEDNVLGTVLATKGRQPAGSSPSPIPMPPTVNYTPPADQDDDDAATVTSSGVKARSLSLGVFDQSTGECTFASISHTYHSR